jgi:Fe-S-cluster-containing dehydrogenase component
MARYGMVIDVDRCTGCYACFLSCRDEHAGIDRRPAALAQPEGQSWIKVSEHESGSFPKVKVSYVPVPCLQCAEAPCMSAATGGAMYRRADGIVMIDPDKAKGQRGIASACPYGAIFWNEKRNSPQKCTFCAHLLDDGWKAPRCVEACPTLALVFGDLDNPGSEVSGLRAAKPVEELLPNFATRPLVSYLGLPARFLAGEVVLGDKPDECPAGVSVVLRNGRQTLTTVTDNYGDFEFRNLEAGADCVVRIEHAGYKPRELTARAAADFNLGTIVLEAAA